MFRGGGLVWHSYVFLSQFFFFFFYPFLHNHFCIIPKNYPTLSVKRKKHLSSILSRANSTRMFLLFSYFGFFRVEFSFNYRGRRKKMYELVSRHQWGGEKMVFFKNCRKYMGLNVRFLHDQ